MKTKLLAVLIAFIIINNILPGSMSLRLAGWRLPLNVFEWSVGYVLNNDGDGRDISPLADDYYNYIAYNPDRFQAGETVFTIFIYNPLSLYCDDIVYRFDFQEGTNNDTGTKNHFTQWTHNLCYA